MPLLIGNLLPSGLLGLLVAGLLAAFMSTHDSYLLCWSSVISQDIIAPLKGVDRLPDRESIFLTRVSVVVIGVFLLVWGIWYELPDSVWTYMGVDGDDLFVRLCNRVDWRNVLVAGVVDRGILVHAGRPAGGARLVRRRRFDRRWPGSLAAMRPNWKFGSTLRPWRCRCLECASCCSFLGSLLFPDHQPKNS